MPHNDPPSAGGRGLKDEAVAPGHRLAYYETMRLFARIWKRPLLWAILCAFALVIFLCWRALLSDPWGTRQFVFLRGAASVPFAVGRYRIGTATGPVWTALRVNATLNRPYEEVAPEAIRELAAGGWEKLEQTSHSVSFLKGGQAVFLYDLGAVVPEVLEFQGKTNVHYARIANWLDKPRVWLWNRMQPLGVNIKQVKVP